VHCTEPARTYVAAELAANSSRSFVALPGCDEPLHDLFRICLGVANGCIGLWRLVARHIALVNPPAETAFDFRVLFNLDYEWMIPGHGSHYGAGVAMSLA
jgi:hypothetical protein